MRRRAPSEPGDLAASGDDLPFVQAAREIARRGFDAVIFGHTHRPGALEVRPDAMYYDTGSWFGDPRYVRVEQGELALERWPTGR